jgi:hypothetical protein
MAGLAWSNKDSKSRVLTMQRPQFAWLATALCLYAAAGHAQMSILPPQCAGKTGDALDKCAREIMPPQRSQRVEPIEQKIDPKQLINCETVHAADQSFCILRNQIILECRKRQKHPDLEKCLANALAGATVPPVANCTPLAPVKKNECFRRNKVYKDCFTGPLRYFICLGEKMSALNAPAASPKKP